MPVDAAHPNAARARKYVDTFASATPEELSGFLADDIVWRVGGNHPLSGVYRGKEAVVNYLMETKSRSDGTVKLSADSILADDQHVALFLRVAGQRDGRQLDTTLAEVIKVDGDGRWKELWSLSASQRDVDAFWAN